MVMRIVDLLGGVYQLGRLGVITRFRFKGPYWEWRNQTAFGRGVPESKRELLASVLEYGVWMHRMRTGR
jgi:hypothetical protein